MAVNDFMYGWVIDDGTSGTTSPIYANSAIGNNAGSYAVDGQAENVFIGTVGVQLNVNETMNFGGDGPLSGVKAIVGYERYQATFTQQDGKTTVGLGTLFHYDDGSSFFVPRDNLRDGSPDNGELDKEGAGNPVVSITFGNVAGSPGNYLFSNVRPNGTSTPGNLAGVNHANYDAIPVCFAKGTLIQTARGLNAVEALRPGDRVQTVDNGHRTIRWVGSWSVTRRQMARNRKWRPILISAGSLGAGLPVRDLLVSRQHRIMIRSKTAHRVFGVDEVLVAATRLVGLPGISVCPYDMDTRYFHVLLGRHELLFADGAPAESLLVGPESRKIVGAEGSGLVSELLQGGCSSASPVHAARLIPEGRQQRHLIHRHAKNAKPLLSHRMNLVAQKVSSASV